MIDELKKLRELTETLTGNGYLRDQAEEWEYALDAIPNPIYIINHKFMIKFVNKAFVKRFSVEKKDCLDKTCYYFITEHEAGDIPEDYINEIVMDSEPLLKERYIEKLNGWFDINRSPIYTVTNKFLGYICVLQDVTDKKLAIDKLHLLVGSELVESR